MKLKNNKNGNLQFFFYDKDKVAQVVHIPGGSTVEIEDDIYVALTKSKTRVNIQEMREEELETDVPVTMEKKNVIIKEFYETGETKVVNLFEERVKDGTITLLEHPQVSKAQMVQTLTDSGIPCDKLSDEQLLNLYNKLV